MVELFFSCNPDNVPGLIPYGIGTGHHGHTGASPGKGNPGSILYRHAPDLPTARSNGCPFKSRPGPVRDLYGRPWSITGILVRARSNPVIGPVRDLTGHSGRARLNPIRAPAGVAIWEAFFLSHKIRENYGNYGGLSRGPVKSGMPGQSRTGPLWDLSGVALARTGPNLPVVPCTNPVQDQTGNVIWAFMARGDPGSNDFSQEKSFKDHLT